MPATLYFYADRVRIVAGRYEVTHPRKFVAHEGSTLAAHRAAMVAAVSGQRGKRYLKRQQLLELGEPRKRPMIFTTNKPLNEWGKVLHDEEMAAAILDRVLERGRFIHLDGPSGRTRHLNLEDTLLPQTERLRISGTHTIPIDSDSA